ncbi:MAG: hypothetical protein EU530_08190 [Promethearchaeota archaeon]|nr:MAG: hypothetical protein EU530_08190 [Candidatus Lokiarchaeota archaeon]
MDLPILVLPYSVSNQKEQYYQYFWDARNRIIEFTKKHNWSYYTTEPFIKHARIFDKKSDFDDELVKIFNLEPETVIPPTYCAILEKESLYIVTPEIYHSIYPEGHEIDSYVKLIVHEIAHHLHIRLLLGNEDSMGPIWFYEGFAIYVADQFSKIKNSLSNSEIKSILFDLQRTSYKKYKMLFEIVTGKIPLDKLVQKAKERDFSNWVYEKINEGK